MRLVQCALMLAVELLQLEVGREVNLGDFRLRDVENQKFWVLAYIE